jgi:hypothetical protein
MQTKLIKLQEGYIITSNEELKDLNWYYNDWCKGVFYNCEKHKAPLKLYSRSEYWNYFIDKGKNYKIIASNFIPELPNIDFNNLEEEFGIIDVEKLAIEETAKNEYNSEISFKMGCRKILEINKDKLYTEEQLLKAIEMARDITDGKDTFSGEDVSGCTEICTYHWKNKYTENDIIQSLQPKTELDIEIETEYVIDPCEPAGCDFPDYTEIPKITNNSIKIIQ